MRRFWNMALWVVLALPLLLVTAQYFNETIYYGQYLHQTGRIAVWLLMLTLAVTPLRLTFARARWTGWLMRSRRYFGVASFGYAVPHMLAYLIRKQDLAYIWEEGIEAGLLTGWIAMVIFAALAITSNNASVRALGRKWSLLHRLVYVAALLTFAHWILTAFDPMTAYAHLAALAALEIYRVGMTAYRARRR